MSIDHAIGVLNECLDVRRCHRVIVYAELIKESGNKVNL